MSKKKVMLIIGDILFPIPNDENTTVNEIDCILFVDEDKVDRIGEEYLEKGFDGYICPALYTEKINSPNKWFVNDTYGDLVAIDEQMRVIVGVGDHLEMLEEYPGIKPIRGYARLPFDIDEQMRAWEVYYYKSI